MKSRSKKEIETKKSIQKRTVSSKRFTNPQLYNPLHPDINDSLTKCQTSRMIWNQQPKMNNFISKAGGYEITLKTSQAITKRQQPTKQIIRNDYQQLLLRKSDKMKLVYWNSDPTLVGIKKIVVSADFIVDQDCFWQKERVEQRNVEVKLLSKSVGDASQGNLNKQWKILHRNRYVIWIVRNRRSWQRIQSLINTFSLPLHAIFLIKKKKNYTVDYSPVEKEILKHQLILTPIDAENLPQKQTRLATNHQSLTIFETIKLNTRDIIDFKSLLGRVPVLLGKKAKVMFMRVDNYPPGLQIINRSLDNIKKPQSAMIAQHLVSSRIRPASGKIQPSEMFPMSIVRPNIDRYIWEKQREQQQEVKVVKEKEQDWLYDQQVIEQKIDKMKKRLIQELIRVYGRNYQFQGGTSIYNIVGEMFKRNYRIMFDSIVQIQYAQQKYKNKQITSQKIKHKQREHSGNIELNLQVDYYEIR